MADQLTPQQMQALNIQARGLVLANAVEMIQQIYSQATPGTPTTSAPQVIQINPRNVGLIKGFLVEINGNIANTGMTTAATRTEHGAMNILTNVTFNDLNNIVRINTSGRHVAMLNTLRNAFPYGGANSPTYPWEGASPNAWTVQSAPSSIAAGANSNVRFFYWVPLAYASDDLRGAIYAAVVNATMVLQLTVNPNPMIASGDPINAVYTGNTGGWGAAPTITVYQVYLDQLPVSKAGPVLPPLDLNTIYELKETNITGMTVSTDFPYSYANFRDFLSTFAIYDNNGAFNAGSDVNYWSLVSANFTQIFKYTPEVAALFARNYITTDLPKGTYYFSFRSRPLNTIQFGNMQLNLNASSATSASLYVSTEAFAQVTTVNQSSSLSAG